MMQALANLKGAQPVEMPSVLSRLVGSELKDWQRERWTWKALLLRDKALTDGAKLLAVVLCDTFANHATGFCNPSVGTLAEALGKKDRAIQRALSELRDSHWLAVKEARGRGHTSKFLFLIGPDPAAFFREAGTGTMNLEGRRPLLGSPSIGWPVSSSR